VISSSAPKGSSKPPPLFEHELLLVDSLLPQPDSPKAFLTILTNLPPRFLLSVLSTMRTNVGETLLSPRPLPRLLFGSFLYLALIYNPKPEVLGQQPSFLRTPVLSFISCSDFIYSLRSELYPPPDASFCMVPLASFWSPSLVFFREKDLSMPPLSWHPPAPPGRTHCFAHLPGIGLPDLRRPPSTGSPFVFPSPLPPLLPRLTGFSISQKCPQNATKIRASHCPEFSPS